jgi:hypothetical protein
MRRYGWRKLPFIAVFEQTKLGWPHLHILLRSGFIDRSFISSIMAELTDSPIVDIRLIKSQAQIAGYVAKYVGQEPHQFGKCKRYWQSQDYDLRPKPEREFRIKNDPFVELVPAPLWQIARTYQSQGYTIEFQAHWRAVCRPPPTAPPRGFSV